MTELKIGDQIWIISFEEADEFYLVTQQTITGFLDDDTVECEDDYNTFHVAYEDIYQDKNQALEAMINRLTKLHNELQIKHD